MRIIHALFCLAATWAYSSSADVLIYKIVESNRTIGYDANRIGTAGGYLVFDWDSGEMRFLRARVVNGSPQFTISNPQGIRVYVAKGPAGSTYTIMSRYEEKTEPRTELLDVMYGVDSVLSIRPGRLVYSPLVLRGTPREIIIPESDDDVILTASTVTAYYLGPETRAANNAGQTVDSMMDRYRALYLARGFFEVPDTQ